MEKNKECKFLLKRLKNWEETRYKEKGSHGCVNMKLADAKVLYTNTTSNTAITVRQ